MRKKTFLFLLIVFVTVGLIGFFITQPVIQAEESGGDEAIKGSIYYSGTDCQYGVTDQVDVYKLTAGGAVLVASGDVYYLGGAYFWSVSATDIDNQTGYYRVVPDLYSASGNAGVIPHVRDSVWWQTGTVTYNQNFTATSCNHP